MFNRKTKTSTAFAVEDYILLSELMLSAVVYSNRKMKRPPGYETLQGVFVVSRSIKKVVFDI